jgi:hypothetical protein
MQQILWLALALLSGFVLIGAYQHRRVIRDYQLDIAAYRRDQQKLAHDLLTAISRYLDNDTENARLVEENQTLREQLRANANTWPKSEQERTRKHEAA